MEIYGIIFNKVFPFADTIYSSIPVVCHTPCKKENQTTIYQPLHLLIALYSPIGTDCHLCLCDSSYGQYPYAYISDYFHIVALHISHYRFPSRIWNNFVDQSNRKCSIHKFYLFLNNIDNIYVYIHNCLYLYCILIYVIEMSSDTGGNYFVTFQNIIHL